MTRFCTCGAPLARWAKKFCPACRKARRRVQLYKAKKRFRRAAKHSHHVFYRGKLSSWALKNPAKALRLWHRRNPELAEPPAELVRSLCTVS